MTTEERERQDLYNEYVLWRLELLHCDPSLNPSDVSDFDEWLEAQDKAIKKPKIRKRKTKKKES